MQRFSNLWAFLAGFIFSMGLLLSQMVNPQKVQNFLDILGEWDPSLLLVMSAALAVYLLGYFLIKPKMEKPWCESAFNLPLNKQLDKQLFVGASLFGIGWGVTGLCPGPALANLAGGELKLLVFVVVMALSMVIFDKIKPVKTS